MAENIGRNIRCTRDAIQANVRILRARDNRRRTNIGFGRYSRVSVSALGDRFR